MSNEKAIEERDRVAQERWKAMMESDFNPGYTPERTAKAEDRMAGALEYAAYQLGQINRRLAQLAQLVDKK
jgi:hypothetical protein